MRKITLLLAVLCMTLTATAQERVNTAPTALSWKSKPVKTATYWEQKDGRWSSRPCNRLKYLGEGTACDNLTALFVGILNGKRYIFADRNDYYWRYPYLQQGWMTARAMHDWLITEDDYSRLDSLHDGETVIIKSTYSNKLWKNNREYSFPFFLSLTNTMYKEAAPTTCMAVRRYKGKDGDVVRFRLGAVPELLETAYFEVSYDVWRNLFNEDKTTKYK